MTTFDPDNPPVRLGPDNERHAMNMFGGTRCSLEDDPSFDEDDMEFVDTGETDITCPECQAE